MLTSYPSQPVPEPSPDALTVREIRQSLPWGLELAKHRACMLERLAPADRPAAHEFWRQITSEIMAVLSKVHAADPCMFPDHP